MNQYEKLKVALRYYFLGKGYFMAADALEFAGEYHDGKRKDGVTPEFQHQIEIAHYVRTLEASLMQPEPTLIACILHDVSEDYEVSDNMIRMRYGATVADAVALLNKNGKTSEHYFEQLAMNSIASVVKGADRINNLQSMVGVFTPEKQLRYIAEVEKYFLPMLKIARRSFARQEPVYENIKHVLTSQLELLKVINGSQP